MIIRGLDAINELLHQRHMENRRAYYRRCDPFGGNIVSEHDEDYLFDALYDVPNR